jgi:hypothetical protein
MVQARQVDGIEALVHLEQDILTVATIAIYSSMGSRSTLGE